MKELMRKGFSLLLFDCDVIIIPSRFKEFNNHSTRWILISTYWFKKVPLHFVAIIVLAVLFLTIVNPGNLFAPTALTIAAASVFPVLVFSLYLPLFSAIFLPKLYKILQTQSQERATDLEKCRKAQLPNPTLVLIWYVLDKTSEIDSLKNTDAYTNLLTQLYGIDQRSIKSSMEIFWGSSRKRTRLSGRARTEIENRFSEARHFFAQLNFIKASAILDELEEKCFSKSE